jgi:hypothetical protein
MLRDKKPELNPDTEVPMLYPSFRKVRQPDQTFRQPAFVRFSAGKKYYYKQDCNNNF